MGLEIKGHGGNGALVIPQKHMAGLPAVLCGSAARLFHAQQKLVAQKRIVDATQPLPFIWVDLRHAGNKFSV
jgi:hypothetical protein